MKYEQWLNKFHLHTLYIYYISCAALSTTAVDIAVAVEIRISITLLPSEIYNLQMNTCEYAFHLESYSVSSFCPVNKNITNMQRY